MNTIVVPQKIKNINTVKSSNPTSGCKCPQSENRILKRCLHIHVHWSFIHNSQEMSTKDEWTKKTCYIHIIEYHLALKKEGHSAICDNVDLPCRHYAKVKWTSHKKTNSAWSHLYEVSNIVKFLETESGMVLP